VFPSEALGSDLMDWSYDGWRWVLFFFLSWVEKEEKERMLIFGMVDLLPLPIDEMSSSSHLRDFFFDMPWGRVPPHLQTAFIKPPSRGGLLGGSGESAPKMSKLQALAAARKKKAQEQKSNGDAGVEKPMAELSINEKTAPPPKLSETESTKPSSRSFPLRKRKDSNPHEKIEKPPAIEDENKMVEEEVALLEPDHVEPSAFASTMFGRTNSPQKKKPAPVFSMPYNMATSTLQTDPFSGPSPDDVVLAAQSQSKGVNSSSAKSSGGNAAVIRKLQKD